MRMTPLHHPAKAGLDISDKDSKHLSGISAPKLKFAVQWGLLRKAFAHCRRHLQKLTKLKTLVSVGLILTQYLTLRISSLDMLGF